MRITVRYSFWHLLLGMGLPAFTWAILFALTTFIKERRLIPPGTDITPMVVLSWLHEALFILTLLYFTLNYFYYFIAESRKPVFYFKLSAFIILAATFYRTVFYFFIPAVLYKNYVSLFQLYEEVLLVLIPLLLFSYLFANTTYMWESKRQRKILEAQKLQLESQVSQANFNFLKSQINPHFLHNTLNFLYAKSLPYSAELSEGILTLSDIMRYALGQGNQKDGRALLKDEIEHVQNVIKISQLRYDNQLNVKFDIIGSVEGVTIIPFALITLVENAFKHGDLKNLQYPLQIKLQIESSRLYFYCSNKKRNGPRQLSTGIGLENIRKRLDIAYGDAYQFKIKDETDFYTTELIINKL